ncbi:unnamed protein product [Closterium sp. NIES-64]|nr:unnamed protein product [Closterium sp. NIES-64]
MREGPLGIHDFNQAKLQTRVFSSASASLTSRPTVMTRQLLPSLASQPIVTRQLSALSPQPTSPLGGPSSFDAAEAAEGELSENDFHRLADEALHWLHENFDVLGDEVDIEGFDVDLSQGVLTLRLGQHGIFVINKQAPNRQIWLSSPQSGPARFDWLPGQGWVYRRTGTELMSLLQTELRTCLGTGVVPSLALHPPTAPFPASPCESPSLSHFSLSSFPPHSPSRAALSFHRFHLGLHPSLPPSPCVSIPFFHSPFVIFLLAL